MKLQCKHFSDDTVIDFLKGLQGAASMHPGFNNSVHNAFPLNTPPKLVIAKMKSLVKRGIVKGCACGCRGDFELFK